jgi:hypothetical protein
VAIPAPRFKSKGEHDGFWADNATDKNHPNAVEVKRGKLSVIGWVKIREPLRFKARFAASSAVTACGQQGSDVSFRAGVASMKHGIEACLCLEARP